MKLSSKVVWLAIGVFLWVGFVVGEPPEVRRARELEVENEALRGEIENLRMKLDAANRDLDKAAWGMAWRETEGPGARSLRYSSPEFGVADFPAIRWEGKSFGEVVEALQAHLQNTPPYDQSRQLAKMEKYLEFLRKEKEWTRKRPALPTVREIRLENLEFITQHPVTFHVSNISFSDLLPILSDICRVEHSFADGVITFRPSEELLPIAANELRRETLLPKLQARYGREALRVIENPDPDVVAALPDGIDDPDSYLWTRQGRNAFANLLASMSSQVVDVRVVKAEEAVDHNWEDPFRKLRLSDFETGEEVLLDRESLVNAPFSRNNPDDPFSPVFFPGPGLYALYRLHYPGEEGIPAFTLPIEVQRLHEWEGQVFVVPPPAMRREMRQRTEELLKLFE